MQINLQFSEREYLQSQLEVPCVGVANYRCWGISAVLRGS